MEKILRFFKGKRERPCRVFRLALTREEIKKMIQELQNLNDNIVKLTASIDAAVAKLDVPHATPADIQAAADAVAAQTARLDEAVASAT